MRDTKGTVDKWVDSSLRIREVHLSLAGPVGDLRKNETH